MKLRHITLTALLFAITIATGQDKVKADFNPETWEIEAKNHDFKEYQGKQALFLDQGKARLKNSSFKNGIIEYDISFEQARNFAGIHFHIQDELNYEEYYLRPHQSGNQDAMQYTPVVNGNAGWQLYSEEGYWSAKDFNFGEWMHVKLVVSGTEMDVFIDDMEKPILHVNELKLRSTSGSIGFGTFLGAAYYANLTYQEIDTPKLVGKSSELVPEQGIVTDWKVSDAFSNTKLKNLVCLAELNIPIEDELRPDTRGILNLSKVAKVTDETNTVLVKYTIDSDKKQFKKMEFGYSDAVTVFVNGKPVYNGDNSFRSRDYRYLGSMGFFDSIFLDLEKGSNEVVFAVTEKMGGWGVMAKISG